MIPAQYSNKIIPVVVIEEYNIITGRIKNAICLGLRQTSSSLLLIIICFKTSGGETYYCRVLMLMVIILQLSTKT